MPCFYIGSTYLCSITNNHKAMSKILNKYIWLAETIYKARKITFEEINEERRKEVDFSGGEDLPLRTFHKWRIGVEDLLGLVIECERKGRYAYYIANESEIANGTLKRWLFDTITEGNLLMENQRMKDRILLQHTPTNNQQLKTILQAMRENHTLRVTYHSYYRPSATTFEAEPYCVKMFRRRWYMAARSPYYKKVMVYALDRIVNLELLTGNKFALPLDFDAKAFFNDCFGVIIGDNTATEEVTLRVSEWQAHYLRDLPLHASQRELAPEDNRCTFAFRLRPTFDFQQELLSLGADVEVIEPHWLRETMKEKIREMAERHGEEREKRP